MSNTVILIKKEEANEGIQIIKKCMFFLIEHLWS